MDANKYEICMLLIETKLQQLVDGELSNLDDILSLKRNFEEKMKDTELLQEYCSRHGGSKAYLRTIQTIDEHLLSM